MFTPYPVAVEQAMQLTFASLNERQRRLYAATEALKLGHGGIRLLSQITGLDEKTIVRGRQEMDEQLRTRPVERIRHPGGGRLAAEKKTPR